jgi:hypothetical protein
MFTILNDKNVSTYLIGEFMSLKCLSRLLYMEPRESGSYSVPSFLSIPRKNLVIILSSSLGGPRDLSTNLNEDSDNQKENVVPNKRFHMVTDEETGGFFLEENLNKTLRQRQKVT